jgi:hypothetical protein
MTDWKEYSVSIGLPKDYQVTFWKEFILAQQAMKEEYIKAFFHPSPFYEYLTKINKIQLKLDEEW